MASESIAISERFWQLYFLIKSSILLVKTSRKTKFLHSLSVEQNAKLLPFFCLCLSFRFKVMKRYLFLKKRSRIFSFRVNDTLTSIYIVRYSSISHFTKRWFKALKRFPYLFVAFKRSHERRKKVLFFQLEAMFWKAPKWYLFCSWKWCW